MSFRRLLGSIPWLIFAAVCYAGLTRVYRAVDVLGILILVGVLFAVTFLSVGLYLLGVFEGPPKKAR